MIDRIRIDPTSEEKDRNGTWILVVDDHRARLLCGRALGTGRLRRVRLDLVAEIENHWHDLQKPHARGNAERAKEHLLRWTEFRQRFATEVGRWLLELVERHGIGSLEVFAPPRMAVMLRREYGPDLAPRVSEQRIDVGNLRLERLESRPEVFALFHHAAG